jgi:hypothetical protein
MTLQHCVLCEWARLEKSKLGCDFLELARHLQQKATHVWPRATLGEAPIAEDCHTFRKTLERTLGGSQRTNVDTHRLRATTLLIEHLAWMPSMMPPPEMPLTQFFGGQAKVVNAGTLSALQRKEKAKPQRPAAPTPSPPPPPAEDSPAGARPPRPSNGTPASAAGHTRTSMARRLSARHPSGIATGFGLRRRPRPPPTMRPQR